MVEKYAVDSSSFIAFFQDEVAPDTKIVEHAIRQEMLIFPPPVVTELVSSPRLRPQQRYFLEQAEQLKITNGFWLGAGAMRSRLLAVGKKSSLGDALIAQCCIDHQVPLITRDKDFRHYQAFGLQLIL